MNIVCLTGRLTDAPEECGWIRLSGPIRPSSFDASRAASFHARLRSPLLGSYGCGRLNCEAIIASHPRSGKIRRVAIITRAPSVIR